MGSGEVKGALASLPLHKTTARKWLLHSPVYLIGLILHEFGVVKPEHNFSRDMTWYGQEAVYLLVVFGH